MMMLYVLLGLAISGVIASDVNNPEHKGNCENQFPKPNCFHHSVEPCSQACGWGISREIYNCPLLSEAFVCERPCYNQPCASDPPVADCHAMTADCVRVIFGRCNKRCGVGWQYERFLCNGGEATCRMNCCCEPCTGGGGAVSSILCKDVHSSAIMCPFRDEP